MKQLKLVTGLFLATSVLLSAGCAGKFRGGDFADRMFNRYDTDQDGYVDKTEYLEMTTSRFTRADDNDDGQVTLEESKESRFARFMPTIVSLWFDENDLNKDEIIESGEMTKNSKKHFMEADVNKDDRLTSKEMKVHRKDQKFDSIDINNDNQLSRKEFQDSKSPF